MSVPTLHNVRRIFGLFVIIGGGLWGTPARAQVMGDMVGNAARVWGTREEVRALADSIEQVLARTPARDARRAPLERDAKELRRRLNEGDLRIGDRVLVRVTTDTVRVDTTTVSATAGILVSGLPEIPVRGVLFSELDAAVQAQVDRYVRNARITITPLVSIGVLGSVSRPGYFLVPHTATVTDALMATGGPIAEADVGRVRLQRAGRDRWNTKQMSAAMAARVSLAALGAENGDVLLIGRQAAPYDRTFIFASIGLVLQVVLTLTLIRGTR